MPAFAVRGGAGWTVGLGTNRHSPLLCGLCTDDIQVCFLHETYASA